jgi:DNA polymerase-3 subunit epsilon/CBS domain-containing protein
VVVSEPGRAGRAGATPLIALEAVVLDCETTGLDVRSDRVVQVAAVSLRGAELHDDEVFDALVAPGIPIPEASRRIHGISDADVAGCPAFPEVAAALRSFIGGRVVIGHSIHFDLAILRHEAARHRLRWTEPSRVIDIALLMAGLMPHLVDTSLDTLATTFGVAIPDRHRALGDARASARVYGAMLPRLLAEGVRTDAEAERVAARPAELIARQTRAGWFDRPDARPDFSPRALREGTRKAIDGFLYRHRLDEVMGAPPERIAAGATLAEAARAMAARGIGSIVVDRGPGLPEGILTERDVLNALGQDGAGAAAILVEARMSAPIIAAPGETRLYRALGLMARRNLRYLGVSDGDGHIAGVFSLRSLLRQRALTGLSVGDEIAGAHDPADLARAQAALPGLAQGLAADGLHARDIAAVIAAEGAAMTARAAELAAAELAAEGVGGAPAPYAVLILGSGGRGESLLAPDQDNALVIDDAYAGNLEDPADWFVRLAERMTAILDRAGVPFCKGGVMARNRPWRRRLSEWIAQIEVWTARPDPAALLNVDIFYDFAPVHASDVAGMALAQTLREAAEARARDSRAMLRALGAAAAAHGAPLGMFGRIRTDGEGRVDLKAGGMLPIVAGARAVALRHGVEARGTAVRLIEASARAGRSATDAALLAEIHGFLMGLVLDQQIVDIEAGIAPSNRVVLRALPSPEADRLRDALGRVDLIGGVLNDLLEGI